MIGVQIGSFTVLAIVRGASIERHFLLTVLRVSETKIYVVSLRVGYCLVMTMRSTFRTYSISLCNDVTKCIHTQDIATTHVTSWCTRNLYTIQFAISTLTMYILLNWKFSILNIFLKYIYFCKYNFVFKIKRKKN